MATEAFTLTIFIVRIGLALLLYAFLFAVAQLVWRDVKQSAQGETIPAAPRQHSALLEVIEGEEANLIEGQRFAVHTITTIGRDLSNDVVVPDTYVSAEHARIQFREGCWWIEDLGATNPTRLNGRPLSANTPAPLDSGDLVQVGRAIFKFRG
ncbi:MAG: FHA domain-containing protein [Ardenticatenia bacterium]|nr:MAG: FHA domain-containing protein [Ardenticatenia bacterium]